MHACIALTETSSSNLVIGDRDDTGHDSALASSAMCRNGSAPIEPAMTAIGLSLPHPMTLAPPPPHPPIILTTINTTATSTASSTTVPLIKSPSWAASLSATPPSSSETVTSASSEPALTSHTNTSNAHQSLSATRPEVFEPQHRSWSPSESRHNLESTQWLRRDSSNERSSTTRPAYRRTNITIGRSEPSPPRDTANLSSPSPSPSPSPPSRSPVTTDQSISDADLTADRPRPVPRIVIDRKPVRKYSCDDDDDDLGGTDYNDNCQEDECGGSHSDSELDAPSDCSSTASDPSASSVCDNRGSRRRANHVNKDMVAAALTSLKQTIEQDGEVSGYVTPVVPSMASLYGLV
jgi:hypothetical protein